jgi:Fe2+ transport system protein FeoA
VSARAPQARRTLAELPVGGRARILDVVGGAALEQRLLEMGLTPGTALEVIRFAPLGDPIEIRVRGYLLSLRRKDAAGIVLADEAA